MPKLTDLNPRIKGSGGLYQNLYFQCPGCRGREVGVDIWAGSAGMVILKDNSRPVKLWHAEQGPHRDWDTLTVSPSINIAPHGECLGWHGHITNGEVTP
jgi:hypothetical protein